MPTAPDGANQQRRFKKFFEELLAPMTAWLQKKPVEEESSKVTASEKSSRSVEKSSKTPTEKAAQRIGAVDKADEAEQQLNPSVKEKRQESGAERKAASSSQQAALHNSIEKMLPPPEETVTTATEGLANVDSGQRPMPSDKHAALHKPSNSHSTTTNKILQHKTIDELLQEISDKIAEEMASGADVASIDYLLVHLCANLLQRSSQLQFQCVQYSMIQVREKAYKVRDSHHNVFGAVLQIGSACFTLVGGCIGGVASVTMLVSGASQLPGLLDKFINAMSLTGQGTNGFSAVMKDHIEGDRVILIYDQRAWEEKRGHERGEEKSKRDRTGQLIESGQGVIASDHKAKSDVLNANAGG